MSDELEAYRKFGDASIPMISWDALPIISWDALPMISWDALPNKFAKNLAEDYDKYCEYTSIEIADLQNEIKMLQSKLGSDC